MDATGETAAPRPAPRRSKALTVVTTSEMQTHRDCPSKHGFRYIDGLRWPTEGKALAIGHIFHGGMSAGLVAGWRDMTGTVADRLARQIKAATATVQTQVDTWAQQQALHDKNADYVALETFAREGGDMIAWMLSNYFVRTQTDLTSLILVDVERPFSVRMRDRAGRKMPLQFDGVRDALFYDPRHNALELHEHKTVSDMPEDIGKRAEMDPQTAGYMYALIEQRAAAALTFLDGTPVPADAVLGRTAYNAVRKKKPRQPKVNKDGKVSIAAIDTTPEIYVAALDEQATVRKIPVTAEQLAKATELRDAGPGRWFHRHEFYRTRAEIDRWRSDTVVDAARIRQSHADPTRRTRNPGNCNMPWSMKCEYRAVCMDDTPETRAMYVVASEKHPEVREAEAVYTTDAPF